MNIETKKLISEFLYSAPLYKKIKIGNIEVTPNILDGATFDFFCEYDKNIKTFELEYYSLENYKGASLWNFKNDVRNNDLLGNISLTYQYKARCQHCKTYCIDFLLNIYSEENKSYNNYDEVPLFLRKIGQYPPFEIKPEREIINFLNKEDKENYKKALISLSQSYGIGAYAYLRRIIENEILKIITEISQLNTPEKIKISDAIKRYNESHQMSNLINEIYNYLPASFNTLGDNPLKLLYSELSKGIHSLNEEDCINRAEAINTVLKFTIKQLNIEKTELVSVKNALNSLK